MGSVYSVGQINSYIKNMFQQDFLLNRVYIKGEVSNCKYHTSGHIYFSLKDETGAISCILFASARKGLAFRMENGQRVVVFGSISVYERDGSYQLYAKEIRLDGLGVLYERFEALRQELEEMGMFAPEYKQPIPAHVRRLGVVTAPTGAAVRDIIHVAKRRNPYVQIILYPARVQGDGAAESIIKGIQMLDSAGVDVIIAGRGGGSIEDLWAFNEEAVARAIFECATPVISAVGHETDTTIADFAADLRAPTPSAGAEMAVEEIASTEALLENYREALELRMGTKLEDARQKFAQYTMGLRLHSPRNLIREKNQQLMRTEEKMELLMQAKLENSRHRLFVYIEKMKGLSPLEKLAQGYAVVTGSTGGRITSVEQADRGELLKVYVTDGCIEARAENMILQTDKPGKKEN
ncbi:MAG: exodeoxyribonuclease VII large subunit [Lachnospiraceae bacterium]|nr:exodeoxyribonuclease VII large subunit [Lachnospiraceae bacterium]